MKVRKLLFVLLATLAATPAGAEFRTQVEAIELTPDNIILPGSVNGTVTFKPCTGECEKEHRRARLTPETEFYVDERRVKWTDFQYSMTILRGKDEAYALVSVDLESLTITSIRINS